MKPRHKLINARRTKGLSQEKSAKATGMSKKALGMCERGQSNPHPDTIKLLCAYYQMSPQELDLDKLVPTGKQDEPVQSVKASHVAQPTSADAQLPESKPALVNRDTWYTSNESNVVSPENTIEPSLPMSSTRREALQLVKNASTVLFFSPYALLSPESQDQLALVQNHPSYLDEKALDGLSAITAIYRASYQNVPLDGLINGMSGHYSDIMRLLKSSHPITTYKRLCTLASEIAQMLGHTYHLMNAYSTAYTYYQFALQAARGDTDMWAAGVGRVSLLLIAWGKPHEALPLLQEVQRTTVHDSRLAAWLSAVTANTYAKVDNSSASMRALEQAKSITVPDHLKHDPYWTGLTPANVAGFEGACYMHLGQPELALTAYERTMALIDPALRLHRGGSMAHLARIHAQLGNPQEACQMLSQVLSVIAETGSLSYLQRVHDARAELHHWNNSVDVRGLDDKLESTKQALKQRTADS